MTVDVAARSEGRAEAPVTRHIERVAIVNRGEAAMRLIHAVRELNGERSSALRVVALATDPDRRALFVREADEVVHLGAPIVSGADGGRHSVYVDLSRLEQALLTARADAVWVGWGFVAEHAAFAELCERLGIVFIGPSAEAMRRLGDKIAAKRLAEEAGVPVGAWSGGPVTTLEAAREHADRLGYPLMIKAAAGGGGRGIRAVGSADGLAGAFESARSEARVAFGDDTVFLERLLQAGRHVEVQVIGDGRGTTWALGVRDCSVQRRHQKIVEESASTALTPEQVSLLMASAERLCNRVGYRGAGTVEFLLDNSTGKLAFMEVNTRLQVEHPVTEMTTGVDLVKLQLHVAMGGQLTGPPPPPRGHAIEVRLCAEDADRGFAPAPGAVDVLRLPVGPGIRVDTGITEGDAVASEFDSMIAKVIAWGGDRREALGRLRRALSETQVVLRGGTTNRSFLLDLLHQPEISDGTADIGWLDRLGATLTGRREHADAALLLAAVEVDDAELAIDRAHFLATAARGRPEVPDSVGRIIELSIDGHGYRLPVHRLGPRLCRVEVDGRSVEVEVERIGQHERHIRFAGRSHRAVCVEQGADFRIEIDGVPHRVSREAGGMVRAQSPAVVVAVRVSPGDAVAAGDVIAVLEAMKMEIPLVAPFAGTVSRVLVPANVQVDAGQALVQLEPDGGQRTVAVGERIVVPVTEPADNDPRSRSRPALDVVRRLMLGFDVDAAVASEALATYAASCASVPADEVTLRQKEDELLRAFADISSLSRPRREEDEVSLEPVRSPQEHLFAYLRSFDATAVPHAYADALRSAVAHSGIGSLERTPELEDCMFRIVRAHRATQTQVPVVLSLLDRLLEQFGSLGETAGDELRLLLDRIHLATRRRHPAVSDLARQVRHRYFDQPLMENARRAVYEQVEGHLAHLDANPHASDRAARVAELVACPQPLHNLLTRRIAGASPQMRELMLEVMTRRYYRIRELAEVTTRRIHGREVATAEYVHRGRHVHVITTHAASRELATTLGNMRELLDAVPADCESVVDVYVWREAMDTDTDSLAAEMHSVVAAAKLPASARRVVVAVTTPGQDPLTLESQRFTFRRYGTGYREEHVFRGLHPLMAERLQLWRLRNFQIERLPSVEDVYLFHGKARDNPSDERLFALAEVRDVTPVRDEAGRVVGLPMLERMLLEALAAIRLFQSHRPPAQRLQWNRVLLYVWPPLDLDAQEIHDVGRRLAPETADLGIEKIVLRASTRDATGALRDTVLHFSNPLGAGIVMLRFDTPTTRPIQPLTEYRQKVVSMRRRGLIYPYEIVDMLAAPADESRAEIPPGEFIEHDLDEAGRLVPVERPPGRNTANLVVGVIRNFTSKHPEGMARVILLGDPSRSLGALAHAECDRIIAALDLAERMDVPLEWFTLSSGAKISMSSGTENMDAIARVLRRLVEFTQAGGEVNLVVNGINVGAQPYWNAEATMLMHTRGILVMTPDGAMVLTGKDALDYSGSVSAEDNFGIGGYERIMGPNGQAQYWAPDLSAACQLLLRHYEHTYRAPGERFPRRAITADPVDRDVTTAPHPHGEGSDFTHIGDIFSDERNAGRKKPFDIRAVMHAVVDQDHLPLERWIAMRHAEIAVVWDAHVGGYPVCLLGLESRPLARQGYVPADGPDYWTPGTLFPQSSKKVARAINSASGNRPVVVLANLAGFDGSPESMRLLQLEFGAEIGRAVVNFRGPLVFVVISRYHGGAFVVFSATLNEGLEVAAVEGSYASVIGGAPAAAVVFAREVEARTKADPRIADLDRLVTTALGAEKAELRARMAAMLEQVRAEKRGEVADEFDGIHTIQRALKVGSVHRIIPARTLRPYIVDAVERGMERELGRPAAQAAAASATRQS